MFAKDLVKRVTSNSCTTATGGNKRLTDLEAFRCHFSSWDFHPKFKLIWTHRWWSYCFRFSLIASGLNHSPNPCQWKVPEPSITNGGKWRSSRDFVGRIESVMLLCLWMQSDAWVFAVRGLSLGMITAQSRTPTEAEGGTNEMPAAGRSDQSGWREGEELTRDVCRRP